MLIRFQSIEESLHQELMTKLNETYPDSIQEERYEAIGPAIGNELKTKAIQSGIKADVFVLFSKSGFSNELLQTQSEDLLLFDLNDLKALTS